MFVEYLVEQRNRQCYEEASRCLVKVRALYQKLGKNEAWTSYIADLREKNRNLRALKEELARMGL
jgi:uncharacterized Zn finger protein